MKSLISVRDLSINFDLYKFPKNIIKREKKLVLDKLNLDIYEGDRLAIIGRNGSGKTTLINSILGFLDSDGSSIYVSKVKDKKEFLKNIGIQFQKASYLKEWTPLSAIKVVMDLSLTRPKNQSYRSWYKEVAIPLRDEMIEFFELKDCLNKQIKKLSGGEQQKLNLLLSLLKKPKVLILDEFTTGLDLTYKYKLLEYIDKYVKENNVTLIVVSHIEEEISSLTDKIALLHEGKIESYVTVSQLKKDKLSLKKYLEKYFSKGELVKKYSYKESDLEKIDSSKELNLRDDYHYKLRFPTNSISSSKTVGNEVNSKSEVSEERELKVNSSLQAYKRLLFNDWWKTGGWFLIVLYFFMGLFLLSLGMANGFEDSATGLVSVNVSQLNTKWSYVTPTIIGTAAYGIFGIWGYMLFNVRSTLIIKRIDISNADKNMFMTYAILMSLFWFFAPLFIMLGLFAIINSAGGYIDLSSYDAIYSFDNTTDITNQVVNSNSYQLKSINWGGFFLSSILTWLMSVSIVLFILSFIKLSRPLYYAAIWVPYAIMLGLGGFFFPVSSFLPNYNYAAIDGEIPEYAFIIPEIYTASVYTVFANPIVIGAQAGGQAAPNYSMDLSTTENIVGITLSLVVPLAFGWIGLRSYPKWTNG